MLFIEHELIGAETAIRNLINKIKSEAKDIKSEEVQQYIKHLLDDLNKQKGHYQEIKLFYLQQKVG